MPYQALLEVGMVVFAADGVRLGKIEALRPGGLLVEKGLLFRRETWCDARLICDVRGDEAFLRISAEEFALGHGAAHDPPAGPSSAPHSAAR